MRRSRAALFASMLAVSFSASLSNAAVVSPLSRIVWSYDVEPNTLRVDNPGGRFTKGQFTSPHDFKVRFGLYNLGSKPVRVDGAKFDFWENDLPLFNDKISNDVMVRFRDPFFVAVSDVSIGVNCNGSVGEGGVSDLSCKPNFKLPPAAITPFAFFQISANDLNKSTNRTTDKRQIEFFDAPNIALRPFGSVRDIDLDAKVVPIPAALPLFLSAVAGLGFAMRRRAKL